MANLSDLLLKTVTSAAGNVNLPANLKNQILNGVSESVLGSLTQTATKAGGIEAITDLVKGKTSAASSPVTALAGKLFAGNVISKLGLDNATASAASGIIPKVMGMLGGIIKDQDGDGDIDLQDFLITLKGGNAAKGGGLLGTAAKGILGSILKGK